MHSHIPVLAKGGAVVGVLRLNDALMHAKQTCPPIRKLMKPAEFVAHKLPVRDALSRLRRQAAGLAVVTGANHQPVGVVTVKDLIEPITGDLRQW